MINSLEKRVIVTVKITMKSLENKWVCQFKVILYLKILSLWENKKLNKVSICLTEALTCSLIYSEMLSKVPVFGRI